MTWGYPYFWKHPYIYIYIYTPLKLRAKKHQQSQAVCQKETNHMFSSNAYLVGGFNMFQPIWKILYSQIGSFPQGSGWTFQTYLSCHHPVLVWKRMPSSQCRPVLFTFCSYQTIKWWQDGQPPKPNGRIFHPPIGGWEATSFWVSAYFQGRCHVCLREGRCPSKIAGEFTTIFGVFWSCEVDIIWRRSVIGHLFKGTMTMTRKWNISQPLIFRGHSLVFWEVYHLTSWWFQHIWKKCSSNWIISPIYRGENCTLKPPS